MRRALGIAVLVGAGGSLLGAVGCTLLVSFDDVPADDAGSDATGRLDARADTRTDTGDTGAADAGSDAAVFPLPCQTNFDLAGVQGCDQITVGLSCAGEPELKTNYPEPSQLANDLVTCTSNKATCVQRCPNGCVKLPLHFPDQCDVCNTMPDGNYCGSDLKWVAADENLVVFCNGGHATPQPQTCNGKCTSIGNGNAVCK